MTGQDRDKFATYRRDGATGLDYADQRYYAQTAGRFLTADPYLASGGAAEPGSWNRYAYVGGDPVNFSDPWGLASCPAGSTTCVDVFARGTPVDLHQDPLAVAVYRTSVALPGSSNRMANLEWIPTEYQITPTCDQPWPSPAGESIAGNLQRVFDTVREIFEQERLANGVGGTTFPALRLTAWFVEMVKTGAEWDYKQHGSRYETFGNFNFAVTGRALGFSEEALLRAAGLVQHSTDFQRVLRGLEPIGTGNVLGGPPFGDDPKDQQVIQRGSEAFSRFLGNQCTFY